MIKQTLPFAVALSIVLALASACKSNKASLDAETREAMALKAYQLEFKPVVLDTSRHGTDSFDAKKIRISGDTLFIDAEYSGGCKNHEFTARHNGQYMKSLPPQLNVTVDHQANGDACRELIRETLAFDLKNCRQGKTGSVVLIINGDRPKKVTYSY